MSTNLSHLLVVYYAFGFAVSTLLTQHVGNVCWLHKKTQPMSHKLRSAIVYRPYIYIDLFNVGGVACIR